MGPMCGPMEWKPLMNTGTQVNQIIMGDNSSAPLSTIDNPENGMMELVAESWGLFVKLNLMRRQLLQ